MRSHWSSTAWVVVIALGVLTTPSWFLVAETTARLRSHHQQFQQTQRATYERFALPVPSRLQSRAAPVRCDVVHLVPEAPLAMMFVLGTLLVRKRIAQAL